MAHLELPDQPAGPILELHGQRKRFTLPYGLKNLLEEMTVATLRHNPVNIYLFLADFLEEKLTQREIDDMRSGRGKHSWEWRRWSWDGSSLLSNDELIAFLAEYNISVEVAQHLATIIQAAYKGYLVRKEFHHVQEKHQHHKEQLWDEWRHEGNFFVSGKDVQDILAYYGISLFEANAVATKIQKVFRGFNQRRSLAIANPELAAHLQELGITHHEADKHATAIQSLFRGYKARKAKEAAAKAGAEAGEEFDEEKHKMEEEEFLRRIEEERQAEMTGDEEEDEEEEEGDFDLAAERDMEDKAASKIQAGFRGMQARKRVKEMRDQLHEHNEPEEAHEEEDGGGVFGETHDAGPEPEPEKAVKYDAYFPGGYDEKNRVVQPDGVDIPPKFTHEHFGDIDPLAIRKKLSDTEFRSKMSFMLKDLNEQKTVHLKEHLSQRNLDTKASKVGTQVAAPPGKPEEAPKRQSLKPGDAPRGSLNFKDARQSLKPGEAPRMSMKPGEAPRLSMKPGEAPKMSMKPEASNISLKPGKLPKMSMKPEDAPKSSLKAQLLDRMSLKPTESFAKKVHEDGPRASFLEKINSKAKSFATAGKHEPPSDTDGEHEN